MPVSSVDSAPLLTAQVAEELTHTCWQMYHQMATGVPLVHMTTTDALQPAP